MNSKGLNISCQRSALPFLAATVLFGLQAANAASYSDTVQADNPIAYYRLAETDGTTAADSSSSGLYPGTYSVSGAYPLLGQPGIDTNSIGLSAAETASVAAGYYAELNPQGPFSFEIWARPTSTPGSGVYRCPIGNFGGWGTGNGYGTGWYVYQQSDSTFAFVTAPSGVWITAPYTLRPQTWPIEGRARRAGSNSTNPSAGYPPPRSLGAHCPPLRFPSD